MKFNFFVLLILIFFSCKTWHTTSNYDEVYGDVPNLETSNVIEDDTDNPHFDVIHYELYTYPLYRRYYFYNYYPIYNDWLYPNFNYWFLGYNSNYYYYNWSIFNPIHSYNYLSWYYSGCNDRFWTHSHTTYPNILHGPRNFLNKTYYKKTTDIGTKSENKQNRPLRSSKPQINSNKMPLHSERVETKKPIRVENRPSNFQKRPEQKRPSQLNNQNIRINNLNQRNNHPIQKKK